MPNSLPDTIPDDPELWPDFLFLCAFGGRLTGTPGEIAARDWAAKRLAAIHPDRVSRETTPYVGWISSDARVLLARVAWAILTVALTAPAAALAALRATD